MTTKVEPTVEKWEEISKKLRLCPECWTLSEGTGYCDCGGFKRLDFNDLPEEEKRAWVDGFERGESLSVQEAKAEREKIVIADDGDYVKVPMTVIKHIWDMRMPQTSHWRESGEIHYNKAIEDILRLIKPNILSTLNTKASLKQEEGE